MKPTHLLAVAMMLGTMLLTGVSCNVASEYDPTPVTHFKITPASGSFAATNPAVTATVASTPNADGSQTIAIAAKNSNLKFDKDSIAATAGSVTIAFNNADSGIPHNIHVFEGTDAKGKSAGQTELASGPTEQRLKLSLVAGVYYYRCDAHPTTMKGVLTAS